MPPKSETLAHLPFGLRLTFSCDYSAKYRGRDISLAEYRESWSLMGHFDVLEAKPMWTLDDAASGIAPIRQNATDADANREGGQTEESDGLELNGPGDGEPLGASISLLLFPSGAMNATPSWVHNTDDTLLVDRLINPSKQSDTPFCHITTLTFSPPTYEGDPDFNAVFPCIEALDRLVESQIRDLGIERYGRFCSLSDPDFVVITFPRTIEEIQLCRSLSAQLSNLLLADLLSFTGNRSTAAESSPGHAFAAVENFLAVNGNESTDILLAEEARKADPQQVVTTVTTELECECGHAEIIAGFFFAQGLPRERESIEIDTARSRVVIRNLSLYDYRKLWKLVIDPVNREGNIYGVSTRLVDTLTGDLLPKKLERPHWEFSVNLKRDLQYIRTAFRESKRFIARQQLERAWAVYYAFEACLRRPETATVAKELLAVLIQFSRMLRESSLGEYLKTPACRSEFGENLNRFLIYMDAAINGRVEQRRMIHDAPFPAALPTGATSVLSCYTAMFYLCWELLTRVKPSRRKNSAPQECPVENFAGGVVGGQEGQVRCYELFRRYRERVEAIRAKKHKLLSPQPLSLFPESQDHEEITETPWRSRICFFEVPSSLLMRTDEAFVQAVHETAEISEWCEHPDNAILRQKMNYWSTSALAHAIVEHSEFRSNRSRPVGKRMLPFALKCVNYILATNGRFLRESGLTAPSCKRDVEEILKRSCRNIAPRQFSDYLWRALLNASGDSMLVNKVENLFYSSPSNAPFDIFEIRTSLSIHLEEILAQYQSRLQISHELIPDVAMCEVLRRLLRRNIESTSAWLEDINRAYLGLFRVACATGIDGSIDNTEQMVAIRWALVISALIRGLKLRNTSWQQELLKSLKSIPLAQRRGEAAICVVHDVEAKTKAMPELFQGGNSVALEFLLSSLQSFGGPNSVWVADVEEHFSDAEKSLLNAFIEAWTSRQSCQSRLRLALSFWAKAQRLRHHKMLVPKAQSQ